jgi:hypothetical protein
MVTLVAIAPLLSMVAVAKPQPVALDSLIGFVPNKVCETTPGFARLLRSFYRLEHDRMMQDEDMRFTIAKPAVAEAFRAAFGPVKISRTKVWTTVSVAVHGQWAGLPMTQIRQDFPDGGDPPNLTIFFDGTTKQLRAALAGEGVRLGPRDELVVDDDIYSTTMRIRSDPRKITGVLLECETG